MYMGNHDRYNACSRMQHHLQNSNAFYLFWLEIGMPGKIGRLLTGELLQHDSLMM